MLVKGVPGKGVDLQRPMPMEVLCDMPYGHIGYNIEAENKGRHFADGISISISIKCVPAAKVANMCLTHF